MQKSGNMPIDRLIAIVKKGGSVQTGVDVFNDRGVLLLERHVRVNDVRPLRVIKRAGVDRIPVIETGGGGVWDEDGNRMAISGASPGSRPWSAGAVGESAEKRISRINEIKRLAAEKHEQAKSCIRKVIEEIKKTGGEFDYQAVERVVTDLLSFLAEHENGFSYLAREISSYDDYLYNHSINVCTIAAASMHRFNRSFSDAVDKFLNGLSFESLQFREPVPSESFVYFNEEEMRNIAIGFFLHDVGKVTLPGIVINKKGALSPDEYALVRRHSYDRGKEILEKSNVHDTFVRNIVRYHHCALYRGEPNCYPEYIGPAQLPPYVKICKLADMYDAMTSRRCYKDALNPIAVVTDLFREYANKDRMLQFILDSFVRTVGIFPAGSVVHLKNGQRAYIIDSQGPIAIPFTSREGTLFNIMKSPVHLGDAKKRDPGLAIDRRATMHSQASEYKKLPKYLQPSLRATSSG